MWLLQSEGKRFLASKTTVSALEKVTRDDTWESEKSMLKKWSQRSGRVVWRECPGTHQVWEYKDTQSISRQVEAARGSAWESGVEAEPSGSQTVASLALAAKQRAKRKALGKALALLEKAAGKARGSSKARPLCWLCGTAQWLTLSLSQRQRHLRRSPLKLTCWQKHAELESMISRQRQATASGWLAALEKVLSQLKASLSKNIGLAAMKALLEDGAALIKGAKDERKEPWKRHCSSAMEKALLQRLGEGIASRPWKRQF